MQSSLRRALVPSLVIVCSLTARAQFNNQWATFVKDTNRIRNPTGSTATQVTDDTWQREYAWGDLDQDGWTDLVVVRKRFSHWNPQSLPNQLLMNEQGVLVDRTSVYATATDVTGDDGFLALTNDRDVQIADVDGDGWLDVITATTINPAPVEPKHLSHPRVYRNLGSVGGVWQGLRFENFRIPQIVQIPGGAQLTPRFSSVSVGDVTGDGSPDLYFTDATTTFPDVNDRLFVNDGTGNFSDSLETRMNLAMLLSGAGISANIVDINGDGTRDVVKCADLTPNGQIFVAYNPPANEGFFNLYQSVHSVVQANHVEVGDLNRDGRPDLIVGFGIYLSGSEQGNVRYNLGNDGVGAVVWGNRIQYQTVDGHVPIYLGTTVVADLDGDQWPDTIQVNTSVDALACSSCRGHIFHNPGGNPGDEIVLREEAEMTGTDGWKGVVGLSVNDLIGTFDVAPFDIDNDGDIDLVFARGVGTTVWMNLRVEAGPAYCFGDGSGAACPCGNASAPAERAGCISSIGAPGRLRTNGTASVSADTLGLFATGVPNGPALFFQGTWAEGVGAGSAFGDGLLCVGGSIVRIGVVFAANNASFYPRSGIDPAISTQAGLAPGDSRTYQAWYRDSDLAFCTPAAFNLTNGLAITWQ